MSRPLVLITETLDEVCARWLAEYADVIWCRHDAGQSFGPELARADALIVRTYTQVNQALLEAAPRLKVVGRAGVGLDNIDLEACRRRGVQVVYTPDANTQAVVEYVWALILDALRPRVDLPPQATPEQFHRLRKETVGQQLDQLTLGILGLGRIGKRVGKVASAIGMKLLVNDLLPESQLRAAVDYPFEFVDKPQLYQQADILTIHVDGRPENRHLINASVFQQLKPACLLINTARGFVIDNQALADWARRVAPAGGRAVLDVHEPEPPPPDYPLYHLPNVRLLPHLASRTDQALRNMSWVVRDVVAVLQGRAPQYPAW